MRNLILYVFGIASRNPNSALAASSPGDYIPSVSAPAQAYTLDKLGFSTSTRTVTLYVEGIKASTTLGDQSILMTISPTGNISSTSKFILSDTVRLTAASVYVESPLDANSDNIVNDMPTTNSYGNVFRYTGYDPDEPNDMSSVTCPIDIVANIHPSAINNYLANKVKVTLESISFSNFTSSIAWNTAGSSELTGLLAYDNTDHKWKARATFTALPNVPTGSWGRVPANMHSLLNKSRNATFVVTDNASHTIWSQKGPYEVCYGNNLKINNTTIYDITCNASIRNALISAGGLHGHEMFEKMLCSTETFSFATQSKAEDNFTMRYNAIHIMENMTPDPTSSADDIGYVGTGYVINGQTLLYARAGDTYFTESSSTPPVVSLHQGSKWNHVGATNLKGKFEACSNISPSDAIAPSNVYPFRGECAGALEICLLQSALNTMNATRFNNVHTEEHFGVGYWSASVNKHMVPIWREAGGYTGDAKTMIPGDYAYIKNKDDYGIEDPSGEEDRVKDNITLLWFGENCIYYGLDEESGVAKFGGLGLNNCSEAELRNALKTGYQNDMNPPFNVVSDPDTEIHFTGIDRIITGE